MAKTTKPCKVCGKEMPKWLRNTCSPKCETKKQKEKEKLKKQRDRERKKVSVSVLTKKADALWAKVVKHDWNNECAYCWAKDKQLHSHHLFTRARKATRWDTENGICLCAGHHTLSSQFSAHQTGNEFFLWLETIKGREWIEMMSKRSQEVYKVTSEWLQEIIKYLQKQLDEYEKQN